MRILRPAMWFLTSILTGVWCYFCLLVLLRGEISVCGGSSCAVFVGTNPWLIVGLVLVVSLTIFGLYGSVKELREVSKKQ